jgi:ACR3 family arsenite efflux pump ArsB
MGLLAMYRKRLADEAAGRSHLFRDIIRVFRWIRLGFLLLAIVFFVFFAWRMQGRVYDPDGLGLIAISIVALLIAAFGFALHGVARILFTPDKPEPSQHQDQ